jgi:hypothetical protein
VDPRRRQPLHPSVPLLEAFSTEPPPLAGVLPRQGPFDPYPPRTDGRVEASLAPALGRLALARTLCDVGDEARMAHAMPMACGIIAALEVEGGASQVRPDLRGHLLQGVEPLRQQEHVCLMDGSNRGGCDDRVMLVCDRDTLFPCPRRVSRLSNSIAPCVATVLVPSPWSTLISRCFAAARWATRAMHACHSDPSPARFVKTV